MGLHFGLTLRNNQKTARCVSVSRFMLARPVSRSVMRAGSCTAWSTASSPTDRCPPTRPSVVVMTRSTPSSPRLAPASTSTCRLRRFGAYRRRRGPHRYLPSALPTYVPEGQECMLPLNPGFYGSADSLTVTLGEIPGTLVDLLASGTYYADATVKCADGSEMTCIYLRVELGQ